MKIIVCDDDALYAESLVDALRTSGHEIVACLSDPCQITPIVRLRHVDACVLNVSPPSDEGLQHIPALCRLAPWMRIVVLAGRSQAYRAIAMEAGASAFLPKGCTIDELLTALGDDEHAIGTASRDVAAPSRIRSTGVPALTDRERQVLQAIVNGESNTAIARRYGLRPSTVRSHVQNLFDKLGVHSRVAAIAYSVRYELVDPPVPQPSPAGRLT